MDFDSLSPNAKALLEQFKCRLPQRMELDCIMKNLPRKRMGGKVMLDIGMPNPIMSALLRDSGGAWATIARSPEDAQEASQVLRAEVACLGAGGEIPFDQHSFDVVVVSLGMLTAMDDPLFFVKECNRVLKASGELIISTQFRKRFSLVNVLRRRAAGDDRKALVSRAYTERGLFSFLKTGFDVISESYFSRFFVELVRLREYGLVRGGADDETVCDDVGWRYKLADQLDFFTLWSKGYVITVHARRRQWRERTAPVLADGRTIHEAVLTR